MAKKAIKPSTESQRPLNPTEEQVLRAGTSREGESDRVDAAAWHHSTANRRRSSVA